MGNTIGGDIHVVGQPMCSKYVGSCMTRSRGEPRIEDSAEETSHHNSPRCLQKLGWP